MGRHRVREERDGGNCRWRYDPETPAIVIFNPPDSYHVSGAILEAYFLYRE
ncbi:MAG: hypothetical protein HYW27_01940 [Candidatus Aenigmarchaeota archaeon]|nr:hypothetical protein [Candidatus Aenigmarchaeota archaeon]